MSSRDDEEGFDLLERGQRTRAHRLDRAALHEAGGLPGGVRRLQP